jgi:hypothetical protein
MPIRTMIAKHDKAAREEREKELDERKHAIAKPVVQRENFIEELDKRKLRGLVKPVVQRENLIEDSKLDNLTLRPADTGKFSQAMQLSTVICQVIIIKYQNRLSMSGQVSQKK